MHRLPVLLAILGFFVFPASLNAVLTFTFSPNRETGTTILTLSGYSSITSFGFEFYDSDGVWDYFNNDGKLYHSNWISYKLKLTMCNVEPQGGFELSFYDRSSTSTTGGDGLYVYYYWGLVQSCPLTGSGSIELYDLLFSKFNPGSGLAKTPVRVPFAIVVEDANGPISPVPEPAAVVTAMAALLLAFSIWRQHRQSHRA